MKIIEKTFNIQTGEETISEREETSIEKKSREKIAAEHLEREEKLEVRKAQRQAILDRLGLTSEEASLLLS